VDTYDTLEGTRLAVSLGPPIWGVRLDSGNIEELAKRVREILDGAGFPHAKIMATNELDEHRIAALLSAGAPVDAFGVGTQLATSADAPALSAVYKMVEIKSGNEVRYTAKFSTDKGTLPGAKQVFRAEGFDVLAPSDQCSCDFDAESLLLPVMLDGELLESLPPLAEIREHAKSAVAALPPRLLSLEPAEPYRVEISPKLRELEDSLRAQLEIGG
jgi:nicotinate phosphoribosyltransferase